MKKEFNILAILLLICCTNAFSQRDDIFKRAIGGNNSGNASTSQQQRSTQTTVQAQQNNGSSGNANQQSGNVGYLNELREYSNYDHIKADLGRIIKSDRQVYKNGEQIVFRYYTDKGWEKTLSVSDCYWCNKTGRCQACAFQIMGAPYQSLCQSCLGSKKCNKCGGRKKYVTVIAKQINGQGFWYDDRGRLQSSNSQSASPNASINNSSTLSSSGSSSSSSSGRSTCTECKGTGICQKCKGRGVHNNTLDAEYVQCPSCNGRGKCWLCYGRGYNNY